jgi:predicted ribosome quality control (RQC) complex YloA/Tae2 family protein
VPIPLDAYTITYLARDLDGLVRGRAIEGVAIGEAKMLAIAFTGDVGCLTFTYDPSFPVLCFLGHEPRPSKLNRAPRFEEALAGCAVTAVEQAGLERVIKATVRDPDRRSFHIYFELTPPFPNLFLTDSDDVILAVLLRAGTQTRRRTLAQGRPYLPPAAQDKLDPFSVTDEAVEALARQEDGAALSKAILGVSPFLARELAWRASKTGSPARAYTAMIEAYRSGRTAPCLFSASPDLSKHPPGVGVSWFRPEMEGVSDIRPMPSVNAAAVAAAQAFLRISAHDRKKASMVRALTREIARWKAVEREAGRAGEGGATAAKYRTYAELILANPARVSRGEREARLPDIYAEGAPEVVVPLDPRLAAHANADAYFKRARRAERGARRAAEMVRSAGERIRELEAKLKEVEAAATGYGRLKELEGEVGQAQSPRKAREAQIDEKAAGLGIRPRRYVVTGGWTVLVGRSAEENDILTHKYANPSDLWFHARQAQGSHVVMRVEKKKTEPPRTAILEAARIAAYFSKAKTSKHVPVSYTQKRYVKKVRRGAPGLCSMLREKVVFVNPAPPQETDQR